MAAVLFTSARMAALRSTSMAGLHSPSNGRTTLRLGFFQKLTNNDYSYDYTVNARDLNPNNSLLRLYLGPIVQYSQVTIDAHRLTHLFSASGWQCDYPPPER